MTILLPMHQHLGSRMAGCNSICLYPSLVGMGRTSRSLAPIDMLSVSRLETGNSNAIMLTFAICQWLSQLIYRMFYLTRMSCTSADFVCLDGFDCLSLSSGAWL